MRFVVVAHHSRAQEAERLALRINAEVLMDDGDHGAAWNHKRALKWAAEQSERVVIVEDDALPVDGFVERCAQALERWPDDLVSFYLGTGAPADWQGRIRSALSHADNEGRDWLALPKLLHGVCYSVPRPGDVLRGLLPGPVDFEVGRSWMRITKRPIVYTVPSLVDHADGFSVVRRLDGPKHIGRRKAWRLAT